MSGSYGVLGHSGNTAGTPDEAPGQERSPFPDTGVGERGTPLYVDVAALLDGGLPDPPAPVLLHRTDGVAIFYAGQVNYLFGDPESGKTLVAQAAASEAMNDGRKVAIIDVDHNGAEATITRFIDMDVDEKVLRDPERFRYFEPEDKQHLLAVIADLQQWRAAVVVVDSIGELLPMLGLSSNSPDDFTAGHTATLKKLAMAGSLVIAIDHLAKGLDSRAQGSTGTAAKRRAVGGVSIRVTLEEAFTPGKGGKAFLTINKDRHGGLRRHCPPAPGKEQVAGIFRIAPDAQARILWTVLGPEPGQVPAHDRVDPADLLALDALDPAPTGVRDVKARLNWRSDRATKAMREWRSQRSQGVPGEQGTGDEGSVPRSRTPGVGNGEHAPGNVVSLRPGVCSRCRYPSDEPLIAGQCRTCAYPNGDGDTDPA